MSESVAAPVAAPAADTSGDAAPSATELKSQFAAMLHAPDGEPAEGKPRAADGKFAKAEGKPEAKPEPDVKPADDDDPDREPTNAERAKFRAMRREVKQARAQLEKERAEAEQLHAAERRIWGEFHRARKEGRVLDALQVIGADPEEIARLLTEQAVGTDPRLTAVQRQLAELEAQRERQLLQEEQRHAQAQRAANERSWDSVNAETLETTGDEALVAIAKDPELLAEVRKIQEEWYADGEEDQKSPRARVRAARELAKRLQAAHTRLGRLFRASVEDEVDGTGPVKPSAPGRLKTPRETRSTRSLGASQGAAKPAEPIKFTTDADRKRWAAELLKNSTD